MKKKILVVDDDESILDALSLILEEEGYTVQSTIKGTEIYNKIKSFKPDLILLDVLISGSDGRQICKNLKHLDATRKIPIIMISAHPTANQGAYDCGADDYLPKPFDTKELLQTIQKYSFISK